MNKVKQLSFSGQTIYCGLDAHKTNWKINCRMGDVEIASFSQNPDAALLKKHMSQNYPDAEIKVVYEAGFCGFGIQTSLKKLGIECIIVSLSAH
jgi:transposase